MATIVTRTRVVRHTIHTTGLSFDVQPDILDLPALYHDTDPRLVFTYHLSGLVYHTKEQ